MPKVSVILPIYNAGDSLHDCLQSLCSQTIDDIEFICVLDCPTDGSADIVESYAATDNRFVIVRNSKNLHIGCSRNRGLEIATGEYIAFADHDDTMLPDMYESLYSIAKNGNTDIVFSCPAINTDGKIIKNTITHTEQDKQRDAILRDLLSWGGKDSDVSRFCYIHPNLYKRELIENYKIRFVDTKSTTPEDVIFNIETLWHSQKMAYTEKSYYYHHIINTSQGHQRSYKSWRVRHNGACYIYDFLQNNHCYEQYECDFLCFVRKQYIQCLLGTIYDHKSLGEVLAAFNTMRHAPYCRKAFKQYDGSEPYIRVRPLNKRIIRRIAATLLSL